jgi:ATP-dependent Lon protease
MNRPDDHLEDLRSETESSVSWPEQSDALTPNFPESVPLLALHGRVPLPGRLESALLTAPEAVNAVNAAHGDSGFVVAVWVSRRAEDVPENGAGRLPGVGVVCRILTLTPIKTGGVGVDLEGIARVHILTASEHSGTQFADVSAVVTPEVDLSDAETRMSECQSVLRSLIETSGEYPREILRSLEISEGDPSRYADLVAASLHLRLDQHWDLVRTLDPMARLDLLINSLSEKLVVSDLAGDLDRRVQATLTRQQRAEFLRTQMIEVRRELESLEPGAGELDKLADDITNANLPAHVARRARSELERLRLISTASAEYSEIRNYIDWLIAIPWTARAHERTDVPAIQHVLEEEFYGQKRAKERVSEAITVLHRTGRATRNTMCLVGPSGIGKTQLGRAVAKALRRPLISLNLGVLRSEAALKGNRRTFPGAMPGRLLRQLRNIEVINPVCLMEEVDRLGGVFDRPDLTAIIMETIDPGMNTDYWDHYLAFPIDLSQVLFICTATNPENIPEMLADRLDIIELPGYLESDKVEVTFKHLWPRQLKAHNLPVEEFGLTVSAVHKIIREYTMEAGLTGLDKSLETICRHVAAQRAIGERGFIRVGAREVEKFLGTPPYIPEKAENKPEVGVAMGLAWTQTGGDIMLIEALKMRGSGNVISTGSLGEVMRESIQAAHSYVRARAEWLGIPHEDFGTYDIHVHFPSGAIPKDGPSAGITVSLVIASVMSDRPIRNDVAMTGEVSLRGKVLPVGGVKEKVAAAHRIGIHKMIVPQENIKDLKDVPKRISKEMTYIPVETVDEVFEAALLDFDPSKASLERLLKLELVKKAAGRKPRERQKSQARRKRAR